MPGGKRKAASAGPPSEAEALDRIAAGLDDVARSIVLSANQDATDAEQAFQLNMAGFTASEIAVMYNVKLNVITARISDRRKARAKRLASRKEG